MNDGTDGGTNDRSDERRDDRDFVWGRDLRRILCLYLKAAGTLTVAEMVAKLEADNYDVGGRASKVVSDALRWEIPWGRVVRVRRGVYRFGRVPRSTEWRMRKGLEVMRTWHRIIRAERLGLEPEPPPPYYDHRLRQFLGIDPPDRYPEREQAADRSSVVDGPEPEPDDPVDWAWLEGAPA